MDLPSTAAADEHLVALYEHDDHLVDAVIAFLAPALGAGDAAVVVATADHHARIEAALADIGVDVAALRRVDRYLTEDADTALAAFTTEDGLDGDLFRATIRPLLDRATADGRGVRVFGEMVARLWEDGDITGAIRLEDLWNELGRSSVFALFCGYPVDVLATRGSAEAFRTMCTQHSSVLPSESYLALDGTDQRARRVAMLQREMLATTIERDDLRDRRAELESSVEQLAELERHRERSVAMIVHDIRGPASMLRAALELLGEEDVPEDARGQLLTTAVDLSARIERLTSELLDVARVDAGRGVHDLQPVDLRGCLQAVARRVASATGRRVEVTVADALPLVLADEERQQRILDNLLSNAVKFSADDTTVRLTAVAADGTVRISVRDEGTGIAPEDHGGLFRPFSHPEGRDHSLPGAGLGLYTAKVLVEDQGGTISVDSEPGVGSTFTYTVPTVPVTGHRLPPSTAVGQPG